MLIGEHVVVPAERELHLCSGSRKPREDEHMDSRDSFLERFEALERRTYMVERRLRWWRGTACGLLVLSLLIWTLPSNQVPDASAARTRHEDRDHKDKDHGDNDVEQRLQALEDKLTAITFDAATNEVVITGANLHIVNGLGATDTTNGLGNLIVGYNELRSILPPPGGFPGPEPELNIRTGSHNVVVGIQHNFSSFGGLLVGRSNTISGPFSSVSGGDNNTASGDRSSVSGGALNTASGPLSSVSGGELNTASGQFTSVSGGVQNLASSGFGPGRGGASVSGGLGNTASGFSASVSGGENNTASADSSSVSGGLNRTAPAQFNWAAGALFSDQ